MRYPTKTSMKEFCDTIAASIARYEKYCYWASKVGGQAFFPKTASTKEKTQGDHCKERSKENQESKGWRVREDSFFRSRFLRLENARKISSLLKSADCKRGRRKGATSKKTSKSVKKFFDTFRQFSCGPKKVKNRQKCQKVFDTFRQFPRGTIFPAPFGGL